MLNENNLKLTIVDPFTIRIDVDSIRFDGLPVYIEDHSHDHSDGSIQELVAPLLDWWYKE